MKAISLWQPWATAVAIGSKRFETRAWATKYRGPLAIHAAKRCRIYDMIGVASSWTWCAALEPHFGRSMMGMGTQAVMDGLPFGTIVAVVDLVDCVPTGSLTQQVLDTRRGRAKDWDSWTERQMGDFSLGRYAWRFENVRRLSTPLPLRGMQSLWALPPDVIGAVEAQIEVPELLAVSA